MNTARVSVNTTACMNLVATGLPSTSLMNSRLDPMEQGSTKPSRPKPTGRIRRSSRSDPVTP